MSFADDLKQDVLKIFKEKWETRDGTVVPDEDDLKLNNDAVKLQGTVLYADLVESTKLVDEKKHHFAAEVYKAFLICACRVIRYHGGEITAFDGDRVMAVFIGDTKNTSAMKAALHINSTVLNIVNPKLKEVYPNETYLVKHVVGIDTSEIWIARTGIRGSNDLVWVGRSANYAAKLCSLREGYYSSWVTGTVYNSSHKSAKYSAQKEELMWEQRTWTDYNMTVYRSNWWHNF
jgi:class 3 adenylate cyclase